MATYRTNRNTGPNAIHKELLYQAVRDLNGLSTMAWNFDIAFSALRNIAMQNKSYFDLIILDVGLPGMPPNRPCLLIELLRQNPIGCNLYLYSSWEIASRQGFDNERCNANKNYVGNEQDYISALVQHPDNDQVAILVCQDEYLAWLKVEVDINTIPPSILKHGWDNVSPYSIQYNDEEATLITASGGYVHPVYNHQDVHILFNSASPEAFKEKANQAAEGRNLHFTQQPKIIMKEELEAIFNTIYNEKNNKTNHHSGTRYSP